MNLLSTRTASFALPKKLTPNDDKGQLIIVPIAPADVVAITSRRVNFLAFMVINLIMI